MIVPSPSTSPATHSTPPSRSMSAQELLIWVPSLMSRGFVSSVTSCENIASSECGATMTAGTE